MLEANRRSPSFAKTEAEAEARVTYQESSEYRRERRAGVYADQRQEDKDGSAQETRRRFLVATRDQECPQSQGRQSV